MGTQSDTALSTAYTLISSGEYSSANALLEEALSSDLENDAIIFTASCCNIWQETMSTLEGLPPYEQGEELLLTWKQRFMTFVKDQKYTSEQTIHVFRKSIFSYALAQYSKIYNDTDTKVHADVSRKMGYCHKQLGDYEVALKYLTEANSTIDGQACILAEMGDCYDLCGETKFAKAIFREAFFVNAEEVDLSFLESPLITTLIDKVRSKGYTGKELLEWLPVYGTLYGIFNVRRTLKSQEVVRLRQDIYALKNELKDPANDSKIITPRLLNMYFWLIDYYDLSGESSSRIREALNEIKLLDENIFALYAGK